MKALTRSYVQAAQGRIEKMNFNSTNGFLQTTINLDTKLPGTMIFALQNSSKGEVWYPNGVNISAAMEIAEGDWVEFTDFET